MEISKFEKLVQINTELIRIAHITSEIANSSASDADKDRQIALHMEHHTKLLEDAKKTLRTE